MVAAGMPGLYLLSTGAPHESEAGAVCLCLCCSSARCNRGGCFLLCHAKPCFGDYHGAL